MSKHKAYQSIFDKLSELKPELASKYCITGYIYPTFSAKSAHWIIKEQEYSYNFDNYPSYDIDMLMNDVFNIIYYSHFELSICNQEVLLCFREIPDENHWNALCMKGVSELKESELKQYGIPLDIWKHTLQDFKNDNYVTNMVKIQPIYSGDSKRPDEFIIYEQINNSQENIFRFKNTETGD